MLSYKGKISVFFARERLLGALCKGKTVVLFMRERLLVGNNVASLLALGKTMVCSLLWERFWCALKIGKRVGCALSLGKNFVTAAVCRYHMW